MIRDINGFLGRDRIFSNMAAARVRWGDALTPEKDWPCTEVPYFLGRLNDPAKRAQIIETAREGMQTAKNQGKSYDEQVEIASKFVKKAWRKIGPGEADDERKLKLMRALVFDKISRNEKVQQAIVNTGTIVEANAWGDTFWGVASCDVPNRGKKRGEGDNHLGKILMEGRDILKEHGAEFLMNKSDELRKEIYHPMEKISKNQDQGKLPGILGDDPIFI